MIKVGTDFSGLGSPEAALESINVAHKVVFACDKDKYAKAAYLANHSPEVFYDDITTRNQAETPKCNGYVFGPPCQAFSISGNRKGFEDTRGTMFFHSLEYIKLNRPDWFLMENVRGLLSHDKVKGSKSKYGRTFGVIRDALGITVNGQHNLYKYDDCVNYHIYFQVLNSTDYGIPQNRERIFIVGFRDEVNFKFPKPFPLKLRLKDMLESEVDEKYYLSDAAMASLLKHYKKSDTPNDEPHLLRWQNNKDGIVESEFAPSIRANIKHGNRTAHIVESICIPEPTKKGYTEAKEYDSINFSNPNSLTRRGRVGDHVAQTIDTGCQQGVLIPLFGTERNGDAQRVYDSEGIARTLKSESGGQGGLTGLYQVATRIRRLTPKEVFRLFGYSDTFFENVKNIPTSDTQLYKLGGNSIVKDTIERILIEICKSMNIPYTEPLMRSKDEPGY